MNSAKGAETDLRKYGFEVEFDRNGVPRLNLLTVSNDEQAFDPLRRLGLARKP